MMARMKSAHCLPMVLACAWLLPVCPITTADEDVRLADGLTISLVADDDLVPDCTVVACDGAGRIMASGPGYIRRLEDRNGDGVFDHFQTLVDDLRHAAHGLYFMHPHLYYVANDGVWRVELDEQGNRLNSNAELLLPIKTGGEHHAHALRMGPDGLWYLIAGNGTVGMEDLQNAAFTQVPNPRAGVLWQISSDWSERRVWAHGFRNAYDFDFAPDRTIVTFDSDGEREVSLPWYRPTRVFRVSEGDDAGWVTRNWKHPNYDPDMPEVLAEFGRGSPTGVVRYRNSRLPDRFHNGTFVLDWTFGRLLFVTDDGKTEVVAEPQGTAGFAVTDMDVLPDGRLAISVGGRGSRGGIYILDSTTPGPATEWTPIEWKHGRTAASNQNGKQVIRDLRRSEANQSDFEKALHLLEESTIETEQIAAMKRLIEITGGLGEVLGNDPRPHEDQAGVFDGYRCRTPPSIPLPVADRWTQRLIQLLSHETTAQHVRHESVRGLAFLGATSAQARDAVLADMNRCEDPTDQLHCLIALARMPTEYDATTKRLVAETMVTIPIRVSELGRNVDRNWAPRLVECFLSLKRYIPDLDDRMLNHPNFGNAANLVWIDGWDRAHQNLAAERFLASREALESMEVANFIVGTDIAVPRQAIQDWLIDDRTRSAAWLQLAKMPRQSDVAELQKAARSVDQRVQQKAREALERLGIEPAAVSAPSESADRWLSRVDGILQLQGDARAGETVFAVRQCAKCHNGAKALGPSLAGISKRFSVTDLLRATVDPSQTIPDRYRAVQVLTTGGEILTGLKIYESVDGFTLLNADARTLRVNADSIEMTKMAEQSLMPEGLLQGASEQEVANLLAYMAAL